MKWKNRTILPLALGLMLVTSGCSLGGCGLDTATKSSNNPVIGIVKLESVVKQNPGYAQYKQLEEEYDTLMSQYKAEQATLTAKAQAQSIALEGLAKDSALVDSLNTELKAKVTAKEQELNIRLQQKRLELLNKYRSEMKVTPTDVDLRIVNLQLELRSNVRGIALTKEGKTALQNERAAKEAELKALLAKRGPAIEASNTELENKVNAELQPVFEAGKQELEAYAQSLHEELGATRDQTLQAKVDEVKNAQGLPNPVDWNTQWQQKLSRKQEEVKAMHDVILEDIRSRVAVIAESKHVDIVLSEYENAGKDAIDLTDDVISSYDLN